MQPLAHARSPLWLVVIPMPQGAAIADPDKFTDPESLFKALEGPETELVSATWVVEEYDAGRLKLLPKRGELPPKAILGVEKLRAIHAASETRNKLAPVIALSHFWRSKKHPDPDGITLKMLVDRLRNDLPRYLRKGMKDMGLFIDW